MKTSVFTSLVMAIALAGCGKTSSSSDVKSGARLDYEIHQLAQVHLLSEELNVCLEALGLDLHRQFFNIESGLFVSATRHRLILLEKNTIVLATDFEVYDRNDSAGANPKTISHHGNVFDVLALGEDTRLVISNPERAYLPTLEFEYTNTCEPNIGGFSKDCDLSIDKVQIADDIKFDRLFFYNRSKNEERHDIFADLKKYRACLAKQVK